MMVSEAINAGEKFDIDEALNSAGFAEFLACFPDAEKMIDGLDAKGIEKIYQTFEERNETAKSLKGICKEEIYRDIKINPEDADLASIDAFIDAEFQRDPEAAQKMMKDFSGQIELFRASKERVGQKQEQLQELGGFAKLNEVKGDLKSAAGVMGFVNGVKRLWNWESPSQKGVAAKKRIAEQFGIISLGDAKAKLRAINNAEQSAGHFSKMRETLFNSLVPMKDIADNMRVKAQDRLKDLFDYTAPYPADLDSVDLKKLEEAQKYFEQLSEGAEGGHVAPVSDRYLEGINPHVLQGNLDYIVQDKIIKEINDAIVGHSLGAKALNRLEKTLTGFISKQEVGSYKGSDARDFVKSQLEAAINNPATPPANRLLAKRIMAKFNK